MGRPARDPARRLRIAVDRLPTRTKEAMLRGIASNRIVVGAYVDPRSGGVCPMLAAHRNGGRTSVASFARAWDEYTGAKRPRRATRREVRTLRTLLEQSLDVNTELERTPIAELAAQIRAEREQLARCRPTRHGPVDVVVPEPDDVTISVRRRKRSDLLTATERELSSPAAIPKKVRA
jgi:hypothetical protein